VLVRAACLEEGFAGERYCMTFPDNYPDHITWVTHFSAGTTCPDCPEIRGMKKPKNEAKLYGPFAHVLKKHPACCVIWSILQSPDI